LLDGRAFAKQPNSDDAHPAARFTDQGALKFQTTFPGSPKFQRCLKGGQTALTDIPVLHILVKLH
jgi:hypothetical protein